MTLRSTFFFLIFSVVFMIGPSTHAADPLNDVVMEANVVQIILNDEHRQGVDWEAIVSDFHTLQLKKLDNPVWADKKYKISVGTISGDDYSVLLDALDTVGKMTQNVQPPLIVTTDVKQDLEVTFGEGKGNSNIQVGLLLSKSTQGELQVHLEPHIGVLIKDDGFKPEVVTLKAQTDVDIKENTTIVVGGITSEREITKTHKFPLLGDLPLVGLVFRNRGRLMEKTETVIFLTPRFKAVAEDKGSA